MNKMDYTINYDIKRSKERFVDYVHNGCGKLCKITFDEETKQYEIKPIENQTK